MTLNTLFLELANNKKNTLIFRYAKKKFNNCIYIPSINGGIQFST